jgi:hypothetical protein
MVKTASTMLPLGTRAPNFSLVNEESGHSTFTSFNGCVESLQCGGPAFRDIERSGPSAQRGQATGHPLRIAPYEAVELLDGERYRCGLGVGR